MKVIVFGNARGFGGAQTAFRRLIDFLVEDGHSVGVIGIMDANDTIPSTGQFTHIARIPEASTNPVEKLFASVGAGIKSRAFHPDLFISVGLAKSASLIARFLPSNTFRLAQDFIFGRSHDDILLKTIVGSFDALAVQAPAMERDLFDRDFDQLPCGWLPCFPDLPVPGHRRELSATSTSLRFAYFGRLAPNKGIDLLIQALGALRSSIDPILDIWGGGSEAMKLQTLAENLGIADRVNFRGRYPSGSDYAKQICEYDGIILPSTSTEGLPLILLEAMSYGVPFLTTRVGAIPDCCVGNPDCILVDPTTEAIREGLDSFVSGLKDQRFSPERLQGYYDHHFSEVVMADRWRTMLQDPRGFFQIK
jgi:glycosyltransferase involved in cell wall biosynthesis